MHEHLLLIPNPALLSHQRPFHTYTPRKSYPEPWGRDLLKN